jgi:RNA-binding motif X-linked protein 2
VFSECGEIEHLNLVRDKQNGKSKGFGFLKYLDERSAILAVDNFNGVELLENVIVVNHTDYTPPKE